MAPRELLEAALDSLPEGIALIGGERQVVFWNRAAEAITGHARAELLAQPIPEPLEPLFSVASDWSEFANDLHPAGRGTAVLARHRLGHDLQAISRAVALHDESGGRLGTAVVFHPARSMDALPHGENGEGLGIEESQSSLEDRLHAVFEDFANGGAPFGVLWIYVDQGHELRRTHGDVACETMLVKVEHAMANGLRPGEELGRWGKNELLVISYERTLEMLAAHAQLLAGLARTADFRWWGDRISLTVSIGAVQAREGETLTQLLDRAQEAVASSVDAGGNHITSASGRRSCLPL